VVNPIVNANITASIGMPALIGSNTQNTPNVNPGSNNFKDFISNLFTTETSKENTKLALDASANEKIKLALYQAASIINLNGNIGNIATLQPSAIGKDMIVSSIMQNNNLSSAERTVFLRALKATAIEIVLSGAANNNSSNTQALDNAVSFTKSIPVNPGVSLSGQSASTAAVQTPVNTAVSSDIASTSGKTTAVNTIQISADFEALNSAVVVSPLNYDAAVNDTGVSIGIVASKTPANGVSQNDVKTAGTADKIIPISVTTTDKAEIAGQVLDLTGKLENALNSILISKSNPTVNGVNDNLVSNDPANAVLDAVKTIQPLKANIEEIINTLTSAIPDPAKASAVKDTLKELISRLNDLVAVVPGAVSTGLQQAAVISADNSAEINSMALSLSSQNNRENTSGGKYTVVASNQPQDIKSIVAKIVILLNELNGSLSVANKQVYASRPDIALELAVNNPSFQQVKAAQEVLAANPQSLPVTAVNNDQVLNIQAADNQSAAGQPAQINANIAQSAFVQPQAVTLKTQPDSSAVENLLTPLKTADAVTVGAVQTATKVLYDKLGQSTQDAPSKNLISDVRWVSDNIIKPAALGNEAAAALGTDKQAIFDRVADFANSIKEQIVLRQVVSNINDSSNASKVNEIKMVLKPENLGSVYISLEHTSGGIKGSILVTNDSVRDTLRANLPELRAALSNIGMTVNNFDISMANSNTGSAFQDNGRQNFSQWQGSAQQTIVQENIETGIDSFVNADGYLNYLA
jgi:flagellar hook-length control protein FliK